MGGFIFEATENGVQRIDTKSAINSYGRNFVDLLGIEFQQNVTFAFFRDDIVDANVVPEVGDIILYEDSYYGVQTTINVNLITFFPYF